MPNDSFKQAYEAELQEAFRRAGRPDAAFFRRCAEADGIDANSKYYEKMADNDARTLGRIEGARDIEQCELHHPKVKSHFVRYYGYTCSNLYYIEVHARAHVKGHYDVIDGVEQAIAQTLMSATWEIDQMLSGARQVLADNGVAQSVRYGVRPLLVPAEIVSPYCAQYLNIIMRADELLGLLEFQRLRGVIKNAHCNLEFAKVDRELKSVSRSAFKLAYELADVVARLNGRRPATAARNEDERSGSAVAVRRADEAASDTTASNSAEIVGCETDGIARRAA